MSKVKKVVDAGVRDLTKMFKSPAKSEIRAFAIELLEAVQAEFEEVAFERGIDRQKALIKLQSLIDEIK